MKRVLAVLVILSAGLLVAAEDKKDAKGDKDKLQGTWRAEKGEQNGKEQPNAEEHVLIFEGDTFTIKRKDEVVVKGTFKLDAAKKPLAIDMEIKESRGGRDDGKTAKGIFELKGDTLKWCTTPPDKGERPTEFSTAEGNQRMLITFKREKK